MSTRGNHFTIAFILSTGLLVAACKPAESPSGQSETAVAPAAPVPTSEEALALGSAAAPPQGVELNASFIDELFELESLGLLTFNNSQRDAGREYFIRLTPQGEAAGLIVVHWELDEQEKAFGPIGVKCKLCDRVVDQVPGITPLG
jgi:hypothetical protein